MCYLFILLLVGFYWMYFFEYELISAAVPSGMGYLFKKRRRLKVLFYIHAHFFKKDNNANNNYFIYLVIIYQKT